MDREEYNREPCGSCATGHCATAEGCGTAATGACSHAEGEGTVTTGRAAHAEGFGTLARGENSHAEGISTTASGSYSHAEGYTNTASGIASHVEASSNFATYSYAHVEGASNTASNYASHAEGSSTTASGSYSHAEGLGTHVNGHPGSHIMGRYGSADADYSWYVANGTSSGAQGLAAKLMGATGNMFIDGAYGGPASDYAELFETFDGKPIEPGYFVTLVGRKIRTITSPSDHILGITSGSPGFLGNSAPLHWQARFLTDEWGRVLQHTVLIPAVTDTDGTVVVPEREELQPRLNPAWDPSRTYVPRRDRPEWVAVGLLGQIRVRDDGTCTVDGFCLPNTEGVATDAQEGFRVMERLGSDRLLILFHTGMRPTKFR